MTEKGFTGIELIDPFSCVDSIKEIHLKCVTLLCKKIRSKASLFYRHYLIRGKGYRVDTPETRFYATFLSPHVFVKGLEFKDFSTCELKKKTYFKFYKQLDDEGGFRNLCYDLSVSNLEDYKKQKKKTT